MRLRCYLRGCRWDEGSLVTVGPVLMLRQRCRRGGGPRHPSPLAPPPA
ncbi:PSPA7_2676 family Cys-rich small protein, partial [Pseudomonas aeruginosa]